MKIESYKQAAAYINEAYEYPSLKSFVFGLSEISFRDIKGIGAINKVLTVEFLLIYLNWINTPRSQLRHYSSIHFEKASEVMRNLYRTQKFNLDVVIYVLTEGQKDVIELGEASFFYPFIDATKKCDFGAIYGMIDDWMNNLQTSEEMIDKILNQFISVITMAKALLKTDVVTVQDGKELKTNFTFEGVPLNTWDIVHIDKAGNRFILMDIRYDKEDALYHYMTIDDLTYETVIKKANRR
ncbi:MAG: hypothetical protein IJ039_10120 [Clostridia bacterium]|nr:hypothetical protein [Clostridia bacterium]